MSQPLNLDQIEGKTAELRARLDRKNPWPSDNESHWHAEGWKAGTRNALDKLHPEAMAAEIRRLRARVTELEGPAVEARAALAALCYDLEDPGTAALGALYLISQATTGIDAPRDDTAEALAKHDADVIRKAAQVLEETDRDDDAVNLLYLLADGKLPGHPAAVSAAARP